MGLNWSKGLEGASRGMQTILGVQEKKIDILYDEIVRENRQRFQTSEREAAEQFRSTEAASERDWRSAEGSEEREWKGTENEADREIRREANETALARIEEDRQYRRSMMEDRTRNTDIREANAQGGADDEVTLETLTKLRDKREELTGKLVPSEGDKEAIATIDEQIKVVEKYGAYGAVAYGRIQTNMQGHPDTARYAGLYASLDGKQRKEIDQAKGKYEGEGMPAGAAYMKAIDEYMQKGGKAPAATGSDTTLDKAGSKAELEGVGNMPPAETNIEVEGGAEAPAKPEFMQIAPGEGTEGSDTFVGPPAPKAAPPPSNEPPLFTAAAPVREAVKSGVQNLRQATDTIQTEAKGRESDRMVRSLKSWVENGEIDKGAATLLRRMHSRAEMKKVLEGSGYSSNMVDKFLEYIYALNA